jgi:peptidoglycan L-alanyl-D-glutamate endopeptidase CwlK
MPSRRLEDAHPILAKAYRFSKAEFERLDPEYRVILTCTHRTNQEQADLYAIGRTKPGRKVTNAKPGQSKHNDLPSKAIDVAFQHRIEGKLSWNIGLFKKFYDLMRSVSPATRWGAHVSHGGHFKSINDAPHYELP